MNPNRRIHKELVVESYPDLQYEKKQSLTLNQSSCEMNNVELAARCEGEIKKFCLGNPGSEKHSLELLHRSTKQGDKEARAYIEQSFCDLVLRWLRLHPQKDAVCEFEQEAHVVDKTFERFWQSAGFRQPIEFNSLAVALHFLQACLNGVILDARRAYLRSQAVRIQSGGLQIEDNFESRDVWDTFQKLIPNEHEQRLGYLLYHCGLKPREIVRFCPGEFSDVHDIYHAQNSTMNRVVRNADLFYLRLH
jgi:hypothetical protein